MKSNQLVGIIAALSALSACAIRGPINMPAYAHGLPRSGAVEQGEALGVVVGGSVDDARATLSRVELSGLRGDMIQTGECGGRKRAQGEILEMFFPRPHGPDGHVCLFERDSRVTAIAWNFEHWLEWCC